MIFLNDYDMDQLDRIFADAGTPNLAEGVRIVRRLAEWADSVSDGWHSWPKPVRAAQRLMAVLRASDRIWRSDVSLPDITDAELRDLVRPIKAFLTRQGVSHDVLTCCDPCSWGEHADDGIKEICPCCGSEAVRIPKA